ncbi:MAG: hypothetical protein OYH77_02070 [Pseudomonadota bacterium]|nr:hypothetical protein [Pseudomonadota bacterium]
MFRIPLFSWILFLSLITGFGLQAEPSDEQASDTQASVEQEQQMTAALLQIQVHILALAPHVNAESFDLLADVSSPTIIDTIVGKAVRSIVLKTIAGAGKQTDKEFKQQLEAFAAEVGIESAVLLNIMDKGTDNQELLEKVWQQGQITAEEWVAINTKVRDETISEQRREILEDLPVQLYRQFAMLTVVGGGILKKQQQDDGQDGKLLTTDILFKAITDNYEGLVEHGLAEGLLKPEKYAAPEALTDELAQKIDLFVANVNASSKHAGRKFFTEKLAAQ